MLCTILQVLYLSMLFHPLGLRKMAAPCQSPEGARSDPAKWLCVKEALASMFVLFRPIFCFVLLASLPFHRFDMPAHGDCKFREEWLVQYTYKEWVMKDGNPRLARCKLKFCMKFSMQEIEEM